MLCGQTVDNTDPRYVIKEISEDVLEEAQKKGSLNLCVAVFRPNSRVFWDASRLCACEDCFEVPASIFTFSGRGWGYRRTGKA